MKFLNGHFLKQDGGLNYSRNQEQISVTFIWMPSFIQIGLNTVLRCVNGAKYLTNFKTKWQLLINKVALINYKNGDKEIPIILTLLRS